ncbi:hypothetical protein GCM10028801_44670 [Nocardioides maradonensis]
MKGLAAAAIGFPLVFIVLLVIPIVGGQSDVNAALACGLLGGNNTAPAAAGPGQVAIGTLNWRGASHYGKNPHPGERSYQVRVPNMIQAIDAAGVSIVGFQEFEKPQSDAFKAQAGGTWSLVSSRKGRHVGFDDAIAYQPAAWSVASVHYVKIPYFNTETDSIPFVHFVSTSGSGDVWVLNTHNPANVGGNQAGNRATAIRHEASALAAVARANPSAGIVMTGDMNDRSQFKNAMIRALAANDQRGWTFANPNSKGIDWILGSPSVTFSGTVVDQSTNDNAHSFTDHPFVHTTASVGSSSTANGVVPAAAGGGAASGTVTMVQANLPSKRGYTSKGPAGIRKIVTAHPDFITLNEQTHRTVRSLTTAVTGYDGWRDPTGDPQGDAGGSAMENIVMWNSTTWTNVGAGRERLITKQMENGHIRSRYATWVVLQSRTGTGSRIVVVATHLPVNPQGLGGHGAVIGGRAASYGQGMANLTALTSRLAAYGPVLVGGDFNNHPSQTQTWAAVPQMTAAGYSYTDSPTSGIDYVFYPRQAQVVSHRNLAAGATSDHPFYNVTTLNLDGAAAGSSSGAVVPAVGTGAGCCGGGPDPLAQLGIGPVAATVSPQGLGQQGAPPSVPGFAADQVRNAMAVVGAGKTLNIPPRGIAIGLMTAYGESKLHNINYGDRDSIGIFQQRNNGAWGTTADRMSPQVAAANFFKALLRVPGWQGMSPTLAAHAVQANADPNYYQPYWQTGLRLYAALQGTAAAQLANPASFDCSSTTTGGTSQISFTTSGVAYVGPYPPDQLMARAQAFVQAGTYDPFFHTVNGSWYRKCQHFVANLSGRAMSGYNTAADGWAHYVSTSAAHPATAADGQSPPIGAWLYFKSANAGDTAGHVVVYLGNNMIASTDLPTTGRVGIVPASMPITKWHQTYLGWAAPWAAPGTGSSAA